MPATGKKAPLSRRRRANAARAHHHAHLRRAARSRLQALHRARASRRSGWDRATSNGNFTQDARVGGKWRGMLHPSMAAEDLWQGGTFREIDPPSHVTYTFAWERERAAGEETIVTLDFEAQGSRTKLTFRQSGFPTRRSATGTAAAGARPSTSSKSICASQNTAPRSDAKAPYSEPPRFHGNSANRIRFPASMHAALPWIFPRRRNFLPRRRLWHHLVLRSARRYGQHSHDDGDVDVTSRRPTSACDFAHLRAPGTGRPNRTCPRGSLLMSLFAPASPVWTSRLLALLRIVIGLIFIMAGSSKAFGYPPPPAVIPPMPVIPPMWEIHLAAWLELVGWHRAHLWFPHASSGVHPFG